MSTTHAPPRIGLRSAGMLMEPEEFDAITEYDDRYRYELINGVLIVNAIPGPSQVNPNEVLAYALRDYQKNHPKGAALDLTLPERYIPVGRDRRQADRVVWAGLGRRPKEGKDIPTIAIEFVSSGKRNAVRDYETKRREYLAVGVVEYWIIDRFRRTMKVWRKTAKRPIVVGESDTYETKLLPGFLLHLDELLIAADGWDEDDED
jgi:Uma2 family endonuclease